MVCLSEAALREKRDFDFCFTSSHVVWRLSLRNCLRLLAPAYTASKRALSKDAAATSLVGFWVAGTVSCAGLVVEVLKAINVGLEVERLAQM